MIEKIIEKLNKRKDYFQQAYEYDGKTEHDADLNQVNQLAFDNAINIVNEVATEYRKSGIRTDELKNVIQRLLLAGYSRRTVIRMVNDIWRDESRMVRHD